jgi:anhydro-N-acetylmuramic acid kinase
MTPRARVSRGAAVQSSMIVAGVMSGTSADGIDVALVQIAPGRTRPRLALLAHEGYAYSAALRRAVLAAMNAERTSTAELARLNWRLGLEYARAVGRTIAKHKIKIDLIGCHGQTLYHQGEAASYAGESFACTWQAGEAAVIAQQLGVPVASNFRPADMAAGGQGAPLVPLLDYVLFADAMRGRVLQNIGGIANLTAIPAGSTAGDLLAFDTGPGNMVIDALAQQLFGKKYDRNGAIAARGMILADLVESELRLPFYRLAPPRSAGREQFGREYATRFLAACRKLSRRPEDAIASATALTAESIARSYKRFVHPRMQDKPVDYILSGGGAHNANLVEMLTSRLSPLGCTITSSSAHGLPVEAKEAAAFALLAWMTWHRLPGNIPAATGTKRAVILGQVTFV